MSTHFIDIPAGRRNELRIQRVCANAKAIVSDDKVENDSSDCAKSYFGQVSYFTAQSKLPIFQLACTSAKSEAANELRKRIPPECHQYIVIFSKCERVQC